MTDAPAFRYEPIALSSESTVVAEFAQDASAAAAYQSEAELEQSLIDVLRSQAYEFLSIGDEAQLVANLRTQLEALNGITFSDAEWGRFFSERIAGANDGIVSTASLVLGVAAAGADTNAILVAGIAGLVAGAMSMAAGEYVSVSSQSDTEGADLARERAELASQPDFERDELAQIYVKRGLEPKLAQKVADQLMAKDALGAHARDELGISEVTAARPVQAALTSAATFAIGAAMPLLMVIVAPPSATVPIVSLASLAFLALLGAVGARAGGADVTTATLRVTFWGAMAMALTAGIGALVGTAV